MFKVGDLVLYLPYMVGYDGWVMYEGIGIVMAVNKFNSRGETVHSLNPLRLMSEETNCTSQFQFSDSQITQLTSQTDF